MILSNSMTAGEHKLVEHTRTLKPEPATSEALASFGEFIGGPPDSNARLSNFYDQAVLVQKSGFQSSLPVELSVCTLEPRELRVRWLERHFKHTQAFVPIGGKPFVMVLAPPTDGDLPNPEDVRAFKFDGNAGFLLHVGVWHEFPFALEPSTQIAVLLTKAATQGLGADNIIDGEGFSEDLEKKDMWKRIGMEWAISLD